MNKKPASVPYSQSKAQQAETIAMQHIAREHIRCDLDTLMWRRRAACMTHRELADVLWLHNTYIPAALFAVALSQLAERLRDADIDRVRAALLNDAPVPGAAVELDRFVRAIEHPDTDADRHAYYVATFRQLIWQVKRHLRDLPTYWDIMPVLVGPQAAGKSSAVAKFAAPLELLYMADADFDVFNDPFRITALNRYYLVCLDEMGRAKYADLERVKKRITSSTVQARAMRSEQERKLPRNASFIGTSNTMLISSIHDTTGMRRFVEISCREKRVDAAWLQQIKSVDFLRLWGCETGLDETAPMSLVSDEHRARYADEITMLSPFDDFVQSHIIESPDALTPLKSIYTRYTAYEQMQCHRPMSCQAFAKHFEKRFGAGIRPGNARHWRGIDLVSETAT